MMGKKNKQYQQQKRVINCWGYYTKNRCYYYFVSVTVYYIKLR